MSWKRHFDTLAMLLLIAVAIFIGTQLYEKETSKNQIKGISVPLCKNLSLEGTSRCLQSELMTFYHYNISNLREPLTERELRQMGGVCWHYSEWYRDRAIELGFNAVTPVIAVNETDSHEIAIISNNEGYCVLDQEILVGCQEVGE